MRTRARPRSRAFVQAELLTILVVVVGVAVLLSITGAEHRRRSRVAGSAANLQKFASGITAFASDNEDRVVSFSWRRGEDHEVDGRRFFSSTDVQAGANQAIAILITHAGRPDFAPISNWFAHALYNYLPLAEYLDEPLPAEFAVAPADRNRIAWQRASRNQPADDQGRAYFRLTNRPNQTGSEGKRWPFSSSYEFGTAFVAPDARVSSPEVINTISQGDFHQQYYTGSAMLDLGRRRLSEVAFPSHKAMVYETNASDSGDKWYFFAFEQARPLVLHADGSAAVRSMKHANRGFQPNNPWSVNPTGFTYEPSPAWEPAAPSGFPSTTVRGMIRWTRSGLRGRDFNGPEVPWSN